MGFQDTVMHGSDRQGGAQIKGDFEMLAANLHVDLSDAEKSPNPLKLASEDELDAYWDDLRSITNASLGSETPRGRR